MQRVGPVLLAGCATLALLAGCESTQDKAAKLRAEGKALVQEDGLTLKRSNPDVEVVDTAVLQDKYGTAVVAELKNTSDKTMLEVPISIDVLGADKTSLYKNDVGGIDASLTTAPVLPAGKAIAWVNTQVNATAKPASVIVKVGEAKDTETGPLPDIRFSDVELREDVDGAFAHGVIENASKVSQKQLVVYAVARKGERIVATGRAIIDRLDPAPTPKPTRFSIYFIGDPKGAKLDLFAPPVQLT